MGGALPLGLMEESLQGPSFRIELRAAHQPHLQRALDHSGAKREVLEGPGAEQPRTPNAPSGADHGLTSYHQGVGREGIPCH